MIRFTVERDGERIAWEASEQVQEILGDIPREKMREQVELYLRIGHTVVRYASIQASEESLQDYFEEIAEDLKSEVSREVQERLQKLRDEVQALKQINRRLPETIKGQLGEYAVKLEEMVKRLEDSASSFGEFLQKFRGPKPAGEIGEQFVLEVLQDYFPDDRFEAVGAKKRGEADIRASSEGMVDVLIEVKNRQQTIPTEEVERFRKDLKQRGLEVGCFISLRSPISNLGNYRIESHGNRLVVFLNASAFAGRNGLADGVRLAYFVARQFARFRKEMAHRLAREEELHQKIARIREALQELSAELKKLEDIRASLHKAADAITETAHSVDEVRRQVMDRIARILNENGA